MRHKEMATEGNQLIPHDLAGKKDLFLIAALIIAFGITTAFFFGFETTLDEENLQHLRATLLQESMMEVANNQ